MKERLTITVDSDILKRVDQIIKGPIKNRSQAIEHLVAKSLGPNIPKKAVILCGGEGTRMRPITLEIPKPLLPIQGKPIAAHTLELFKKFGIADIILSVGYKKEQIKEYFGDGSKFGVHITYIDEDSPLGTAGWLSLFEFNEPIFVTNGDELKNVDLEAMYSTHKRNKARCTIALTTVDDPTAYGVAEISGSKIHRFVEKPQQPPSKFINAGLYIIEPSIKNLINEGPAMFETDLFPKIAKSGKLCGHPFTGQWFDGGTPERYEIALREWRGF